LQSAAQDNWTSEVGDIIALATEEFSPCDYYDYDSHANDSTSK